MDHINDSIIKPYQSVHMYEEREASGWTCFSSGGAPGHSRYGLKVSVVAAPYMHACMNAVIWGHTSVDFGRSYVVSRHTFKLKLVMNKNGDSLIINH